MKAQQIRWLEELEQSDEQSFGPVLVALGSLANNGLSISPGFVISTISPDIIRQYCADLEARLDQKTVTFQVSNYCQHDHCPSQTTRNYATDATQLTSLLNSLAHRSNHDHQFLVQAAITSETSGNVAIQDQDALTIRAIAGEIMPLLEDRLPGDKYVVARSNSEVIQRDHNKQFWQINRHGSALQHIKVPSLEQSYPKLNESLLATVAELLEEVVGLVGDQFVVYWSIDSRGQVWIQSLAPAHKPVKLTEINPQTSNQLQGLIAVRGHATGPARIVHGRSVDHVEPGSIIVTELADHALIPLIGSIRGIVTETGRIDSQLAAATRKAGIPYIYGVRSATHKLHDGQLVTVSGDHGLVSIGKVRPSHTARNQAPTTLITGTKVYTTLGPTSSLAELADSDIDGLGLLSVDDLINHPIVGQEITSDKYQINDLSRSLQQVASALTPRPVYLSLSDRAPVADEAHGHRLLGYRGALRHLTEPTLLQVELEAIAKARAQGLTNIYLTLPFVRTYDELTRLQGTLARFGLTPANDFKLSLLCQTPANVINLEKYLRDGTIQSITLDLDSLTELTLGFDRNLEHFGQEYGSHDNALVTSFRHSIDLCRHYGVSINAFGDNLEHEPELVAMLVQMGITSLTIPTEDVLNTRHLIASAEQRLLLDHALNDLQV